MIVAVANTKGGVGKTTLALNLAVERARAGFDVWLIDGDRQGTVMQAIAQRAEVGADPAISVAQFVDGPLLRAQVLQNQKRYQDVVIDVGGRDSTALRAALILSDIVLIPFEPRSFSVWGVSDMADLIAEAQSTRDGLRAFAVLNGADSRGTDNAEAAAAVAEFQGISYLDCPIGRRKAIADAAGSGLAVSEWATKDTKAIAEMARLVEFVFKPVI